MKELVTPGGALASRALVECGDKRKRSSEAASERAGTLTGTYGPLVARGRDQFWA
jgi:hypothetical protein